MGCGCQNNSVSTFSIESNIDSEQVCGYTQETLLSWKSMLECIKETGQYVNLALTVWDINVFLGNVISALNNSICHFSAQLDQIQPYILNSINLGICQA
jgi:hypothetical protein